MQDALSDSTQEGELLVKLLQELAAAHDLLGSAQLPAATEEVARLQTEKARDNWLTLRFV